MIDLNKTSAQQKNEIQSIDESFVNDTMLLKYDTYTYNKDQDSLACKTCRRSIMHGH